MKILFQDKRLTPRNKGWHFVKINLGLFLLKPRFLLKENNVFRESLKKIPCALGALEFASQIYLKFVENQLRWFIIVIRINIYIIIFNKYFENNISESII